MRERAQQQNISPNASEKTMKLLSYLATLAVGLVALIGAINQIKKHSVVVLVEQNFYMASCVGDYFYILDDGMAVHNGHMAELVEDDELKSRYLGI